MDENAYRATYHAVNKQRCVFEKAINSRRCSCIQMKRILLASREAIGCESLEGLSHCQALLDTMRDKARFVLHLPLIAGPLPHNKEIRVQVGGLQGLQALLQHNHNDHVNDVYSLIAQARDEYEHLDRFPYTEMVQGMAHFKGRPKRRRPK